MDAAMLTGGVIMLCPLVPGIWGGHPSLSIRPLQRGSFPLCLANETFPPDCSPEITRSALVPGRGWCQRSTWEQRYVFTCNVLSYLPNFPLEKASSGKNKTSASNGNGHVDGSGKSFETISQNPHIIIFEELWALLGCYLCVCVCVLKCPMTKEIFKKN